MLEQLLTEVRRGLNRAGKRFLDFIEDDGLDSADWEDTAAVQSAKNPYDHFDSLAALLPHASWLSEEMLFALESVSPTQEKTPSRVEAMGFVLELTPPCGADKAMEKALRGILALLPKGTGVQIMMLGDPRVEENLHQYVACRNDENYRQMAKRRQEFYLSAAYGNLFAGLPYRLRALRLIMAVTVPVDGMDARSDIDQASNLRTVLSGTLGTLQMHPRCWGPAEFLQWMDLMGNPELVLSRRHLGHRNYDEQHLIRDQVFAPETVLRVRPRHLHFGVQDSAVLVRAMSAHTYPNEFSLESAATLIGDKLRQELQYPCPFLICLGIMTMDFESAKSKATIKAARATTNASSPMARFLPEFAAKKADWDRVIESFSDGEGLVRLYHQALLFDHASEIDKAERSAEQIWRARAFSLHTDRYMQLQAWLSTIPMMITPTFAQDLQTAQRFATKTIANAVNMAPIVGEWTGFGDPMLLLWGRSGQCTGIDFFANPEGNYNVAIAAGSGAGKSVLGNEMIAAVRGVGGKAYIVDAGRSYEKTCKLHGGRFIEFTPEHTPNFNAFGMIEDLSDDEAIKDAIIMIAQIVNSMAAPDRLLGDYEQGIVEQVVQDEIAQAGKQGSFTGVHQRLVDFVNVQTGQPEPIAGQLAQSMRSYTKYGVFAKYFEGGGVIDFDNDFICLELDGLASSPRLQSTVLMIVMFRITQAMYLDRSVRKIVLIDEAWQLMREGATAKFIETGYRRARKYNGQFATITQSFNDYFKTTAARACYENSDWVISLRQSEETWAQTFAQQHFVASPAQQVVLRSLKTEAGRFSEIFVKMPQGWGCGRLILDPTTLLEYSSKAEDFNAVNAYVVQGYSIPQAIERVLADRGSL